MQGAGSGGGLLFLRGWLRSFSEAVLERDKTRPAPLFQGRLTLQLGLTWIIQDNLPCRHVELNHICEVLSLHEGGLDSACHIWSLSRTGQDVTSVKVGIKLRFFKSGQCTGGEGTPGRFSNRAHLCPRTRTFRAPGASRGSGVMFTFASVALEQGRPRAAFGHQRGGKVDSEPAGDGVM